MQDSVTRSGWRFRFKDPSLSGYEKIRAALFAWLLHEPALATVPAACPRLARIGHPLSALFFLRLFCG